MDFIYLDSDIVVPFNKCMYINNKKKNDLLRLMNTHFDYNYIQLITLYMHHSLLSQIMHASQHKDLTKVLFWQLGIVFRGKVTFHSVKYVIFFFIINGFIIMSVLQSDCAC